MANLELLNRKDALTGFHTKEGLIEYITSKLTPVYEKPQKLTVVILDLDNFKGINDRYGHLVGDDALKHFSTAMNQALKGRHFVARYGGDEFVVVMFNTPYREDLETAKRVKTNLHKEKFYTSKGECVKLGTSIGIAHYPEDGKTARQLLEAADQALYYAKKHGRDKIIVSQRLKSHSIKDKAILIFCVLIGFFVLAMSLYSYRHMKSLRGVSLYARDIRYYVSFRVHSGKANKNYCYLDLKDGSQVEGWIIDESKKSFLLSTYRPKLRPNPFAIRQSFSTTVVTIPKNTVASFVKVFKE